MNTNSKGFWAYVKSQCKTRGGISDLKNNDQEPSTDNEDKANISNNYFASVFVNEPVSAIPVFDLKHFGTPVTEIKIEKDKLFKQLQSLKIYKSMGPYVIPKS